MRRAVDEAKCVTQLRNPRDLLVVMIVLVLPPLPPLCLHGDPKQLTSDCPVSHIGRSNSGVDLEEEDVAQRVCDAVVSSIRAAQQQFDLVPVPVVEERAQF